MKTKFYVLFVGLGIAGAWALPLGLKSRLAAQNAPLRIAQQKPVDPFSRLVQTLELQLAQPLADEQKQRLFESEKNLREALKVPQNRFVRQISQISGLSLDQIRQMLPRNGQPNITADKTIIRDIESTLGRALTSEEIAQISRANQEKNQAVQPIQERFARDVSEITGLSIEQIRQALPAIAPSIGDR